MYGPDFGKAIGCALAGFVLMGLLALALAALWFSGVQPGWWLAWVGLGGAIVVAVLAVGGWLYSLILG